jgi:hypothetical protein
MTFFKSFITRTCLYSTALLCGFFAFASLFMPGEVLMPAASFFTILAFGAIMSGTDLLTGVLNIHRAFKLVIHYAVLLIAFCTVFIFLSEVSFNDGGIVIAIVLFTVLYFGVRGIHYLVTKNIDGSKIARTPSKKAAKQNKSVSEDYKPRF